MNNCTFCKIINGDIPCRKIYEDDIVIAFLDINPVTPGHTLVIPKVHTLDIQTIDKNTLIRIIEIVKKLSEDIKEKLNADGYTILQNNGIAEDVKHFHMHIIPKYKNNINLSLDDVFKKIKNN